MGVAARRIDGGRAFASAHTPLLRYGFGIGCALFKNKQLFLIHLHCSWSSFPKRVAVVAQDQLDPTPVSFSFEQPSALIRSGLRQVFSGRWLGIDNCIGLREPHCLTIFRIPKNWFLHP